MPTNVVRLESRRAGTINGQWLDPPFEHPPLLGPQDHLVEHAIHQPRLGQMVEGAAQRIVIRRTRQADVALPLRTIFQQRFHAAVTFLLVLAQNQTSEPLWERKVLTAELGAMIGEEAFGQAKGPLHHPPWRFAGYHSAVCNSSIVPALPNRRRTFERIETEQ